MSGIPEPVGREYDRLIWVEIAEVGNHLTGVHGMTVRDILNRAPGRDPEGRPNPKVLLDQLHALDREFDN